MTLLKTACVQVNASDEMEDNIKAANALIDKAHAQGAELICLPENVSMMEFGAERTMAKARPEEDHPALVAFKVKAAELKVFILIGSLAIKCEDGKLANRSYLIDADGHVVASYDKIHLFDVDLPNGESYRESSSFNGGLKATLAETPWGLLGMTVCYDLRFPHLYRRLAQAGAKILTVPAAFTKQTGEAHWDVLLRARAIENGCFVIAPGQCGTHQGGRQTYGHSVIIDPWGRVLAQGGTEPGLVIADLDLDEVEAVRSKIPSLKHDKIFEI